MAANENEVVITVKGLEQTLARLQRATFDLQGVAAKRAVVAAARHTAKVAQSNAPVGQYKYPKKKGQSVPKGGTLRRAIIGHYSRKHSIDYLQHVAIVRVQKGKRLRNLKKGSKDAYYAGWVEFGHLNVPRHKGKYLNLLSAWAKADKPGRFRTGINIRRRAAAQRNSRTPPHPFLKPAWEATKVGALRIIEESLRRSLNRADKGK